MDKKEFRQNFKTSDSAQQRNCSTLATPFSIFWSGQETKPTSPSPTPSGSLVGTYLLLHYNTSTFLPRKRGQPLYKGQMAGAKRVHCSEVPLYVTIINIDEHAKYRCKMKTDMNEMMDNKLNPGRVTDKVFIRR